MQTEAATQFAFTCRCLISPLWFLCNQVLATSSAQVISSTLCQTMTVTSDVRFHAAFMPQVPCLSLSFPFQGVSYVLCQSVVNLGGPLDAYTHAPIFLPEIPFPILTSKTVEEKWFKKYCCNLSRFPLPANSHPNPSKSQVCKQALWDTLDAGWEKKGELATTSLEFEFYLQFPCGSPSTGLSDLRQST